MSQVILKLANGDKINSEKQKEKFVNWGSRKYKYSDLEEAVMNNSFDEYLSDRGINGKNAEEIRGYFSNYLNGFKEGKINRNADGTYTVTDLSLSTDMKPIKRGVFGKIRGDKKQIALGYFNTLFDKISPYVEPSKDEKVTTPIPKSESLIDPNPKAGIIEETPKKEETPKLEPFKVGYGNFLRRKIFRDENASEEEQKQWFDLKDRWTPALEALQDYENSLTGNYDFSKTDFKDINTYKSYIQELRQALENKNPKAVSDALYKMGESDLNSVFAGLKPETSTDKKETNPMESAPSNLQTNTAIKEFAEKSPNNPLNWAVINPATGKNTSLESLTANTKNPEIHGNDEKINWGLLGTRIASAVADLSGLAASATGVGSPVAAGLGFTGTLTNLGADIADPNVSKGQTALNAITGTALDALSLIPFAKVVKIPRTISSLTKITPAILTILSGMDVAPATINSFKKINSKEKLTNEDYTNILHGLQLVTNVIAGSTGYSKSSSKIKGLKDPENVKLKTNEGKVVVSNEKVKQLEEAKTLEKQNEILKDLNVTLPEKRKFFKKTGEGKVSYSDYYDVNRTPVYTKHGVTLQGAPLRTSDKWLLNMDVSTPDWIKNLNFKQNFTKFTHPQQTKRYNKEVKAKKAQEISQKEKDESKINDVFESISNASKELQKAHTSFITSRGLPLSKIDRKIEELGINPKLEQEAIARDNAVRERFKRIRQNATVKNFKDVESNLTNLFRKLYITKTLNRSNLALPPHTLDVSEITRAYPLKHFYHKPTIDVTNTKNNSGETLRELYHRQFNTFKNGGILKADNGIQFPITNTTQKNSYNRSRDLLNDKSVFNYLDTITPENYMEFNGYEDNYDSNYINTYGKDSLSNWGNTRLTNLNFYKPTKDMQFAWNSRGLNSPIFKGFNPAYGGASGDNAKGFGSDGAFGEMTIERTLGRGIDDATAKIFNDRLKSKGLEYYKDANHGGYRIRPTGITPSLLNGKTSSIVPKPDWDLNPIGDTSRFIPKAAPLNNPKTNNPEDAGKARGGEIGEPKKINLLPFIPGMLSGLRFGLNYLHNKNIKYNPKVSFLDAPTLYGKVQYNLPARTLAEKQANQFRRRGANLVSADPNENAARSAEFEFQAHNAEDKGALADWQTYAKTSENVQNIQNRNTLAAIDVSNKNRGKADAVREAKAAFERAKNMKLADNTSKFLYERQANWQNKLNRYNVLEDKIKQDELETAFKKSQNDALIAYNKAKSAYKGTSWETSPEYISAANIYKQAIENAVKNRNNKMWDFQRSRIMFSKKGGSLDRVYLQNVKDYNKQLLENQKELNKFIRLSISENNKTIRGLSNYSARLIEKAIK